MDAMVARKLTVADFQVENLYKALSGKNWQKVTEKNDIYY